MITLDRVTKRYGNKTALDNVTLTISRGKIAGLLGRNGAGKTTALNLLTGYFAPDSGQVYVSGMDMMLQPSECKRHIGYLPEKPPLYDEMTVRDYLDFVCDLKEVDIKDRRHHVSEILKICAIEDESGRLIGNLSKGYRQRVGIAQALCGNPEVLILDEPTVGLDPMQTVGMRRLIQKLGEEHTVLFSSHILSEVQQLCSTVYILHEGKLIRSFSMKPEKAAESCRLRVSVLGDEKEILTAVRSIECVRKADALPAEEKGVAEIRITGIPMNERGRLSDQVFFLLAAMGTPIRRMVQETDDLETVFLQVTSS